MKPVLYFLLAAGMSGYLLDVSLLDAAPETRFVPIYGRLERLVDQYGPCPLQARYLEVAAELEKIGIWRKAWGDAERLGLIFFGGSEVLDKSAKGIGIYLLYRQAGNSLNWTAVKAGLKYAVALRNLPGAWLSIKTALRSLASSKIFSAAFLGAVVMGETSTFLVAYAHAIRSFLGEEKTALLRERSFTDYVALNVAAKLLREGTVIEVSTGRAIRLPPVIGFERNGSEQIVKLICREKGHQPMILALGLVFSKKSTGWERKGALGLRDETGRSYYFLVM